MKLRIGLVAASLFGALVASPAASAMPIAPAPATPQVSDVEQVRMVCDAWGRCFWRPNYYGYYGAAAVLRSPILGMGRAFMVGLAITDHAIAAGDSRGALRGPFAFARSACVIACWRLAGAIPKLI